MKINKEIRNYLVSNSTVMNYFNEEFKTINYDLNSKYRIWRVYGIKIRNEKQNLKEERRSAKKLYEKVKVNILSGIKSERKRIISSEKYILNELKIDQSFKTKFPTFKKYIYNIKINSYKNLLTNKYQGQKQVKGIAISNDHNSIKKSNIKNLISQINNSNKKLILEISSINSYLNEGKTDAHIHNLIKKYNDKLKQSELATIKINSWNKKNNSDKLKQKIKEFSEKENNKLMNQRKINAQKVNIILERINLLKSERNKRLSEFKKLKLKEKPKNNNFIYIKSFYEYLLFIIKYVFVSFIKLPFSTKKKVAVYSFLKKGYEKLFKLSEKQTFGSLLSKEKAFHLGNAILRLQSERKEFLKNIAEFKKIYTFRQEQNLIEKRKKIINKYKILKKKKITIAFNNYKNKELTLKAFWKIYKDIKRDIKGQRKATLNSELYNYPSNIFIYLWRKFRIWVIYKTNSIKITKELNAEIEHSVKSIPIQLRFNIRFLFAFINFAVPGISHLLAKQWKKAIIFLLITSILYATILPYSFGVYNFNGNGVLGLKELGTNPPITDSRFFLIEGTTGLVSLIVVLCYCIWQSFEGYKMGLIMEKGLRPSTWFMSKKFLDKHGFPYIMSIPSFIVMTYTVIMPVMATMLLAFTNYGLNHNPTQSQRFNWVGFDNFKILFDPKLDFVKDFLGIVLWTLIWAVSTTIITLVVGFTLAMLLNNERIKFSRFWRTIHILPWVIPGFVFILLFKILLQAPSSISQDNAGPLYNLLVNMNILNPIKIVNGSKVVNNILNTTSTVKIILIFIQVWLGVAGTSVFYSSMLKSIPKTLYEAAKIDGANGRKQLARITIPILLAALSPLLIRDLIGNFNNFGVIWLFNDGGPTDPLHPTILSHGQTDIVLSWIYKMVQKPASIKNGMGMGAAAIVIISIIMVTLSYGTMGRTKAFREEV